MERSQRERGAAAVRITVELPDDLRLALDAATRADGVSASEVIVTALRTYLIKGRFRELQAETIEQMRMSGRGDLTDEDVFRTAS